jgi:hypothetical protein
MGGACSTRETGNWYKIGQSVKITAWMGVYPS